MQADTTGMLCCFGVHSKTARCHWHNSWCIDCSEQSHYTTV
jgi:hypothetical protein